MVRRRRRTREKRGRRRRRRGKDKTVRDQRLYLSILYPYSF